jgi:dihydroxyacid dehydratase/phosphogluconate dehydratase
MEETYQVTSALKQLPCASRVALITQQASSGTWAGCVYDSVRLSKRLCQS